MIPQMETDGYKQIHSEKLTLSIFINKLRPYFSFALDDEKENAHTFLSGILGNFCDIEDDENDKSLEFKEKTAASYLNGSRTLPEQLVNKIIRTKDKPKFQAFLNECNDDNIPRIVKDFASFIPEITDNNFSEVLTDCFEELLHSIINKKNDKASKTKNFNKTIGTNFSDAIKSQLYLETGGYCAIPECRKKLSVTKDGNIQFIFTPAIIDKTIKSDNIHNLIALCPNCTQTYLTEQTENEIQKMKTLKASLEKSNNIQDIAYSEQIQNDVIVILSKIPELTKEELAELNFKPVPLANKFDKSDYLLEQKINAYVQAYYRFITEESKELAKQNLFDYELFASQIKTLFLKLEKQNIPKSEIFESLSSKLKNLTNCRLVSCEAVIASLVQRCDVFREEENATA